jgi:hypothetical protein
MKTCLWPALLPTQPLQYFPFHCQALPTWDQIPNLYSGMLHRSYDLMWNNLCTCCSFWWKCPLFPVSIWGVFVDQKPSGTSFQWSLPWLLIRSAPYHSDVHFYLFPHLPLFCPICLCFPLSQDCEMFVFSYLCP